ncbi:S8 family serine peptidase [Pendulispora albinea]|uniref:S8 family serine peptidase n=1 Tax=Pendulispora albinea TaxID=2741071 RepID=A0ABZ2LQP9_9BACT
MKLSSIVRLYVLGSASAMGIVACADSSMAPPGGSDGVRPGFSQSALGASGWAKLDATLRARSMDAGRAASTVAMFVQSRDPEATKRLIESQGGSVGTVAGDVLTARVPRDAMSAVANARSVLRLEGARLVRAKLDKAEAAIKVDQVHRGEAPLPAAFKGSGAVVGVLDTGIDVHHAAFKKADGSTRIRAVWDQGGSGTPPAGFRYGMECTAAKIDAKTCGYRTATDHGTHVTGIAAGGPVANAPYVGVAPEADIVFVALGEPEGVSGEDALSTAVCDAASYVFKTAAAANMPAVVNMSIGEHSGPHDGSALADRCLDNLSGPGKILVAAAGNEGRGSKNPVHEAPVVVHAMGTASAQPAVIRWVPGQASDGSVQEFVYVWSDPNVELSVRVGFERPDGTAAYSNTVGAGHALDKIDKTMLNDGPITLGPITATSSVIPSGARNIQIALMDSNNDGLEGEHTWLLEITGQGRFDAFIDTTSRGGFLSTGQPPGVTSDSSMTIGYPAIASKVLAVASFVTRNSWRSVDGAEHLQTDEARQQVSVGALSTFSSHGPSRHAESSVKPDIAAPGEIIASALNGGAFPLASRVVKAGPDGFVMMEGTSMASPMAAGVVALMLQRNPALTVDDIRGVFDRTAEKPEGVSSANITWGRGKIDALAALQDKEVARDGDRWSAKASGGCQMASGVGLGAGLGAGALALVPVGGLLRRRRRRIAS